MLDTFNTQNAPLWSAEYVKETKKLAEPTFHGPTAKAIIARYAACIERDEVSDTFTLKDRENWPLRGIVDDADPNLGHILAIFYWLNVEIWLASQLFLTPAVWLEARIPGPPLSRRAQAGPWGGPAGARALSRPNLRGGRDAVTRAAPYVSGEMLSLRRRSDYKLLEPYLVQHA